MQVGIGEIRAAATPESVKKLSAVGYQVCIESGAGLGAHFTDKAYSEASDQIVNDRKALSAPMLFKIHKSTLAV